MDSLCFNFSLAGDTANVFGQPGVIGRCYYHVTFGFATCVSVLADVASCFVLFMADGDVVAISLMFVLADGIAICFVFFVAVGITTLIISCTKRCTTCCCCCYFLMEPCITELKQYALIHSCYKRKKTICAKPSKNVSTPHGPSIELN